MKLTERRRLAAALVLRRVVQLLVFGRRCGEDGGDRQQDGGSVGVTQLVDHDGGQNHSQQLEVETGSKVKRVGWDSFSNRSSCVVFLAPENIRSNVNVRVIKTHRQNSQREDDTDHDVNHQQDVVHDDGEAGLRTGGEKRSHVILVYLTIEQSESV